METKVRKTRFYVWSTEGHRQVVMGEDVQEAAESVLGFSLDEHPGCKVWVSETGFDEPKWTFGG